MVFTNFRKNARRLVIRYPNKNSAYKKCYGQIHIYLFYHDLLYFIIATDCVLFKQLSLFWLNHLSKNLTQICCDYHIIFVHILLIYIHVWAHKILNQCHLYAHALWYVLHITSLHNIFGIPLLLRELHSWSWYANTIHQCFISLPCP